MTKSQQKADYVRPEVFNYVVRAEDLLRRMSSKDGGSLRLLAFQVKEEMDGLITLIDGRCDHGC